MKLIIQIPAFNEAETIARTIADLPRRIQGITSIEFLVIDDGSTDDTIAIARRAGVHHVVSLLNHRGLATAFKAGIDAALAAGADIIVNTDADNQYKGAEIQKLVDPILRGEAEVVIGDRQTANSPHMGLVKRQLQRLGSWAVGLAAGKRIPDVTSGFRAFTREAALQMNVFNPFTYTLETIIQAGHRNLSITSVPISTNEPTRPSRLYRGNFNYVRKSIVTIFRIYALYRPLKTFFVIGAILFLAGALIGARFLSFYFSGDPGGHVQSLILASILLIIGFQTMLIGLLADLISVNRRVNEELLLRLRRSQLETARPVTKPRSEIRPDVRPAAVSDERSKTRRPRRPEAPTKKEEPQWVWLMDGEGNAENRAGNAAQSTESLPSAPEASDGPKRRRRRRGGARHLSDTRRHHQKKEHSEPAPGLAPEKPSE